VDVIFAQSLPSTVGPCLRGHRKRWISSPPPLSDCTHWPDCHRIM